MAKHYSVDATISYPWEQAVAAFWLRYPNPHSKHVLTEDVLERRVDSDGRLHTRRLFKKTNSMPSWIAKIVPRSPKDIYVVEDSICDASNKTLHVRTVNVGYSNIMVLNEYAQLRQGENTSTSSFSRSISALSSIYGFASALQMFAVERYKRNATAALKGYSLVLGHLHGHETVEPSSFDKRLQQLEKLRKQALKAGEFAKDKSEVFVHSNFGSSSKSSRTM